MFTFAVSDLLSINIQNYLSPLTQATLYRESVRHSFVKGALLFDTMGAFIDLTGQRFGKLIAQKFLGMDHKRGGAKWLCICDCGNEKEAISSKLKMGNVQSCGCLKAETIAQRETNHGHVKTPIYRVWSNMKTRCTNPRTRNYHRYGGRGITVCDHWQTFINFYNDVFAAYEAHVLRHGQENTTIERIDNDKGYSKENCRFATYKEQRHNQSV